MECSLLSARSNGFLRYHGQWAAAVRSRPKGSPTALRFVFKAPKAATHEARLGDVGALAELAARVRDCVPAENAGPLLVQTVRPNAAALACASLPNLSLTLAFRFWENDYFQAAYPPPRRRQATRGAGGAGRRTSGLRVSRRGLGASRSGHAARGSGGCEGGSGGAVGPDTTGSARGTSAEGRGARGREAGVRSHGALGAGRGARGAVGLLRRTAAPAGSGAGG